MKILINLLALRSGGGQKVGYNLVKYLIDNKSLFSNFDFWFLCAKDSMLHNLLKENNEKQIFVINIKSMRDYIINYYCAIPKILKELNPKVIYSIFGYPLYPKKYTNVIGEAASNIFFPEIDFWQGIKGLALVKRKFVDYLRIRALKQADGVIFENEAMFERAKKIFRLTEDKICFIKPSIDKSVKIPAITKNNNDVFKLLLLCSWQLNKNIMIIPELLSLIKERKENIKVIFSVNKEDNNETARRFINQIKEKKVEEYIDFIGQVSPDRIQNVYSQTDVVLLLSKLESFSNNIIEAWQFKRPLIISDMEWSRAIIKTDACCFVQRDSAEDIFTKIIKLKQDKSYYDKIVENGLMELQTYLGIDGFAKQIFDFVEKVANCKGGKNVA